MASRNWAMNVAIEDLTDEELQTVTDPTVEGPLQEGPEDSPEAQLTTVQGADQDIERLIDDGEQLADDTAEVKEQIKIAESAGPNGMDETAAAAVGAAIESACSRWGVPPSKNNTVATESFGSPATRERAQQVAIEGFKERLTGLYKTGVKWIMEIYNAGKGAIDGLRNAGIKYQQRAGKFIAAVDQGLGEAKLEKVSGSFITSLSVDGSVDFNKAIQFARKFEGDVVKTATSVKTVIDEAGKILRSSDTKADITPTPFGQAVSKKITGVVPTDATNVKLYALFANNYLVHYTSAIGVPVVKFVRMGGKADVKDLPILDAGKLKAGAEELHKVGVALETKLNGFKEAHEKLKSLKDEAEKLLNGAIKDSDEESFKAYETARQAVVNFKQTETAATTTLTEAAKGLSGYVSASLAGYGKAKPATAE